MTDTEAQTLEAQRAQQSRCQRRHPGTCKRQETRDKEDLLEAAGGGAAPAPADGRGESHLTAPWPREGEGSGHSKNPPTRTPRPLRSPFEAGETFSFKQKNQRAFGSSRPPFRSPGEKVFGREGGDPPPPATKGGVSERRREKQNTLIFLFLMDRCLFG